MASQIVANKVYKFTVFFFLIMHCLLGISAARNKARSSLCFSTLHASHSPKYKHASTIRPQTSCKPFANLLHQLNIRAGLYRGSRKAYDTLWANEIGSIEGDEQALQTWQQIHLSLPQKSSKRENSKSLYPLPFIGLSPSQKLIFANLRAESVDDFLNETSSLIGPAEQEKALAVIQHFQQRFQNWWQQESSQVDKLVADFAKAANKSRMNELLSATAALYACTPEKAEPTVQLMLLPTGYKTGSSGLQLHSTAIVEARPQKAGAAVDVATHELVHYLFEAIPKEKLRAIQKQLSTHGSGRGYSLWNLLDEGFATAIGNCICRRPRDPAGLALDLQNPGAIFRDDYIEPAAIGGLPIIEKALADGVALQSIVDRWAKAVANKLGERLYSPVPEIRTVELVLGDPSLNKARRQLQQKARLASVWTHKGLNRPGLVQRLLRYRDVSIVFMLQPEALDVFTNESWQAILQTETVLPQVHQWLETKKAVVVRLPRPKSKGSVYLCVGSPAAMNNLVSQLAKLHVCSDGLVLAID